MLRKNTEDMYKAYKKANPDSEVTYTLYKHVLSKFAKKAIDKMLEGKTLNLGHKLGNIRVLKVKRDFSKPTIDWGETNKLKAQGINKHVYYTDPFWYRWYWNKKAALKNKTVYSFQPTQGPNGNVKKLSRTIKNDPFAELKFNL